MGFDKTIQMCIFGGNPNGQIMCELSNWTGKVYKISRTELAEFSKRNDCEHTGIYFLYGKNENNDCTVYIGEAEKINTRIKQHVNDNEYWNDCVVVMSNNNHLNKAHVKYLESKFYELAVESERAKIINSTKPTCSSVSEYDQAMLLEFISNAKLLVNTLGYKTFDSIEDSAVKENNNNIEFILITQKGARAKGYLISDGFIVLKDSVATEPVVSMSSSLVNLRNSLLQNQILSNNNIFIKDHRFTSPSSAAAIILGRNANGRIEWKTTEGRTVKEIEENLI